MPFDATPQSLEQRVNALLATPEPLKAWLRTQPPDDSAGSCMVPWDCLFARFFKAQSISGSFSAIEVIIVGGEPPWRRCKPPKWAATTIKWFDSHHQVAGPTHAQVLAYLEGQ